MKRANGRRGERGVVLLLVLWVFMTLGVLALDFSSYMRDDAMAALNLADETRSYYVALAGMNRALYENTRDRQKNLGAPAAPLDPNDPEVDADGDGKSDRTVYQPDAEWHEGDFDGAKFKVRLAGEDGKIPLNIELADDVDEYTALLHFVITNLVRGGNQTTGVDKKTDEQISTIVDSILDWRDCDDEARLNGAETAYYAGLPRPYAAKNGFFDSADELMRIKGVTPEVFYGHDDSPGLVDIFTPYPRGEALVINASQITAQAVRALVPDMSLADAEDFVAGRAGDPEGIRLFLSQSLDASVPGLGARVVNVEPKFVRVEARADLTKPRNQSDVMAVVELAGTDYEEPVIHSWLDRAPIEEEEAASPAPAPAKGRKAGRS